MMGTMSSQYKSAVCVQKRQTENVRIRIGRLALAMQASAVSFIGRHSNSILTVSKEMMRQSIVSIARLPCV